MIKKKKITKKSKPDVVNKYTGDSWAYSKKVRQHFFKPQNLLWKKPSEAKYEWSVLQVVETSCGFGSISIQRKTLSLISNGGHLVAHRP